METGRLIRGMTIDDGTFGTLYLGKELLLLTVEPELKGNAKNISCIPTGDYKVVWHNSPRYGWCYKVKGVQGRSDILIHAGNIEDNTEGCIIVGMKTGELNGKLAVLESSKAVGVLEEYFKRQDWYLTIVDAY